MCSWCTYSSISSVDLARGSSHGIGMPLSAYGGRPMWAGTSRIGLTVPGSTRPSDRLWQRLYLRPLPHQQGSLACGRVVGALASDCIDLQDTGSPRGGDLGRRAPPG